MSLRKLFIIAAVVLAAAACEKEKVSIPDAEHAEAHLVHPELYWDSVFNFVEKYVK